VWPQKRKTHAGLPHANSDKPATGAGSNAEHHCDGLSLPLIVTTILPKGLCAGVCDSSNGTKSPRGHNFSSSHVLTQSHSHTKVMKDMHARPQPVNGIDVVVLMCLYRFDCIDVSVLM
jgi:hypothetical protein